MLMLHVAFVSLTAEFVVFKVEKEQILVVRYLVVISRILLKRKRAAENGAAAMVTAVC
jgi:hypothetical protein